ncbi:TlpA disulfide reductase family protein [Candidatus Avoscillospira sp. LCP25S3_F1]|uniref:TlpA disulfide reductase family protein n=1 Tax=Candidatus Avoscillospira sp. LCP25S3_F1 TaxID=3438825 RepID=UPI003F92C722
MKKLWSMLVLTALLTTGLTACGGGSGQETGDGTGVLAGFTAQDLEGNDVDDSIFDNYDVTMVNVWGTFCGPCIQEMPDLGKLAEDYAGKGLQIVGIVSDATDYEGGYPEETVALAKEIVEETGADYLHLLPSQDLLDRVLSSIQVVPTTFFVDSEGNQLGGIVTGSKSYDEWTALFDKKLEEAKS